MTKRSVKKMSPRTKEQFKTMRNQRKEMILDAALHVFAEEGYHSASISKIAKKGGVSKGLMYNYFESKQDLLSVLLHSIIDERNSFMEKIVKKGFDDAAFEEVINHTVQTLKADPKHWKLYFLMAIQPEVLEMIMKEQSPTMQTYKMLFYQYFKEKYGDDAEKKMYYFTATFSGIRMNFVLNPDTFPLDDVRDQLIDQFVKQ